MSDKTCIHCQISQSESKFSKDTRRNDGLCPYCKKCRKELRQAHEVNREKSREANRRYFSSLKDRPEKAELLEKRKAAHRAYHKERQLTDKDYRDRACERSLRAYKAQSPEQRLEQSRRWRAANLEHVRLRGRELHLKTTYGLTLEQYEAMAESQGWACAICRRTPDEIKSRFKVLVVDHSHKTGKVRSLLCYTCNYGLGHFEDDPGLLLDAIDYLLAHK